LGQDFDDNLGRSDGADVARSLHAHFEQDLRDWFYGQVWPYFTRFSEEQWPHPGSTIDELNGRITVSFFQSICGCTSAIDRAYIPIEKAEWYRNWLLRLNLDESGAKHVTEGWLPEFDKLDRDGQLQLFLSALSKSFPEMRGRFFLLQLYSTTLDLRVQATTARAFGDGTEARRLYTEAASLDEQYGSEIRRFSTGGGECYVLENDDGLLITVSQQYGSFFHVWTTQDYAQEMNEGRYSGSHRVSLMDFRELAVRIHEMRAIGVRMVTVDRRMNGDGKVLPVLDVLEHVEDAITAVGSTEIGKRIQQAFDDSASA